MNKSKNLKGGKVTGMASDSGYGTNYAVWRWNGTNWDLYENHCDYGCVPMEPPSPGEHIGDLAKTSCARA